MSTNKPTPRSWEEYLAIGLRRRWWILLPLFLCWAAVWGVSWFLPNTYQSEALILVDQQKVPDKFVAPNVDVNLQDRIQSVTQQILSRTRLQATIDHFQLYTQPHGLSAILKAQDPIDQMRNDIKIDLVDSPGQRGDFSAFKIRYSAGSPELARRVNSELAALFVDENAQTDRQLSENTTSFLENQLADARAKMEEQEAKVAAFKMKHIGDLPAQLESNVQILAGLQAQLQNTQHALDAAKQQKIYLESMLQQYQSAPASQVDGGLTVTPAQALDKELLDMRLHLEDLRSRYTDDYPDIAALQEKIAKTENLRKAETEIVSSQEVGKATNAVVAAPADRALPNSPNAMIEVQSQLKANQLEIQNDQQQEKDLQTQISGYQVRLNMIPETEQELTDISRGYDESKSNYDSLLQKEMQSQLATSLEQRQQGEQFRILDPPTLPNKPSAPNRFRISVGGLVLGIAVGVALAAFLESTDVRVHREKDLQGLVPARVLVGIPRLSTPREDHFRQMTHWMEFAAAVVMATMIAIGNLYALHKG